MKAMQKSAVIKLILFNRVLFLFFRLLRSIDFDGEREAEIGER